MPALPMLRRLIAALCLLTLPALVLAQPATSAAKRLADVEALAATLAQSLADLRAQNTALAAQLATQSATVAALQAGLQKEVADRTTYADAVAAAAQASANAHSDARLAPVSDKLVHFSRSGNQVYVTGANLHVRSGLGATLANGFNGLGNLIVGYNESRGNAANPDVRTGSHNIVAGRKGQGTRCNCVLATQSRPPRMADQPPLAWLLKPPTTTE